MIVKIYDTTEQLRTTAEVFDFRHLHEINKLDVLTGYILEPIEKGERILYKHKTGKWYEFIVDEPNIIHEDGTRYYFTAIDSLIEIDGDWIADKRPTTLSNAVVEVLAPTRWTLGTITSKPNKLLTFYRITAREALDEVLKAYPVEFQTRITVGTNGVVTRTLDVLDRIGGDYGKRYVYDKDIISVKRTYRQGKIVTALYGYGKGEEVGDGYGRRIDFASINGGLAYVFDPAVLAQYGRMNGGTRVHVFDYVVFDNVSDKAEVLLLTQIEYLKRSVPQVSYEASAIDLGLAHERVGIGDTVKVIDGEHRYETRINYLLETEDGDQVRLATYIRNITDSNNALMDKVGDLASHAGVWDKSQKLVDGSYLNGVLDALNNQANASGGWTTIQDGRGILTIDAPTEAAATKAVNIVGGTIRVASFKNPDGTWKWRTFITGEVIAADMITAGILKGGKVHWNLETGVFYIGNTPETANLRWDGTSLYINGNSIDITSNPAVTAKVGKNEVISQINLSPESIKIAANKIDINGAVTFNSLDQTMKDTITGWEKTYNVSTTQRSFLLTPDGLVLNDKYAYEVEAKTTNTATVSSVSAVFLPVSVDGGSGHTMKILSQLGTTSNHPKLYLSSGTTPAIMLYSHETIYPVIVTHRRIAASESLLSKVGTTVNGWAFTGTTKINGGEIQADTVKAVQIDVAALSAISADVGTVNAGIINSANGKNSINLTTGTFTFDEGITKFDGGGIKVGLNNTNSQMADDGFRVFDGAKAIGSLTEAGAVISELDVASINGADVVTSTGNKTLEVGYGKEFPTISSALSSLDLGGKKTRYIRDGQTVTVNVTGSISDDVFLYGWTGGTLNIVFISGARLIGRIYAMACTTRIIINGTGITKGTIRYNGIDTSGARRLISAYACSSVTVFDMRYDKAGGTAIFANLFDSNSRAYVYNNDYGQCQYGAMSYGGSSVSAYNNIGTCQNNGYFVSNGSINAIGTAPKPAASTTYGWYTGTVTLADSVYQPPAYVAPTPTPTVFTDIFKPIRKQTYIRGTSTVAGTYGSMAAQGKVSAGSIWTEGRITFGIDVAAFWQGGTNISVRMRLHRKNTPHGLSAACKPDPDNFLPTTWPTAGALQGGWSDWATISSAEFSTTVDKEFRFYSGVLNDGYAIWDDCEVEVTVTKNV